MGYEYNRQDLDDFLMQKSFRAAKAGSEIVFDICPYCHGGKHHDKRTFSINENTGLFECKRSSCSVHGNMLTLARDFDFQLRDAYKYGLTPPAKRKYKSIKQPEAKIVPKDKAIEYLQQRGISQKIAEKYEITVQNKHDNVLVFPFRDEKGILRFVKYRNTTFKKGDAGAKEWCESECKPILFGMPQCNMDNKTLVITEGQIDSLTLAECNIENAVSVPTGKNGFTWVPNVWEWFCRFSELIIFGDCENGKITLVDELKNHFPGIVKVVRQEDYKGCKDANDIMRTHGKQAVIQAVHNAELIPIQNVLKLSMVKKVDLYKLPRLETKVHELDRLLGGGLFFGQVAVITGKRGDGKSTFLSQLIANAIDQKLKTFIYSGELPNYLFKAWLDRQIAGRKHVTSKKLENDVISYSVSDTNTEIISNWYDGLAYIYDSNSIEDEETNLLKLVEQSIQRYCINVICIDNLMMAISLDGDKYDRQSNFVKKLRTMAINYDVLILLVAHRRKTQGGVSNAAGLNDEVSGSSDVTNMAGVVISYDRIGELDAEGKEDSKRRLILSKNRLEGKLTDKKGIIMEYEEASKRVYASESERTYSYSCFHDDDGFMQVTQQELESLGYESHAMPFD